ncbi:MAG: biotin--[acetyl-CoA-carboxylase] ligase, partial [Gemmatimonadota bacterium]|nr:biotin--[acetyl-CoA-carboxylase] ligase [Gemmatimonadota bacterium]
AAVTTYDGQTQSELARRWDLPRVIVRDRVSSTLDVIHEVAKHAGDDGTLVLADEQTAGRGRLGRRWHSAPGQGIWLGYLMRSLASPAGGVLALRVGLAVAAGMDDLGLSVRLKWPNDLIVLDRKLGGILCEARWKGDQFGWVAIGLGLNITGPMPTDLAGQAIAAQDAVQGVTRMTVLDRIVPALRRLTPAPELDPEELRRYAERDWLRGRCLEAPIAGIARGVDGDGALLVESARGTKRVVGGSVVAV